MPRNVNVLPEESKVRQTERERRKRGRYSFQCKVSADRKWRQEKLYQQMTEVSIDEVSISIYSHYLYSTHSLPQVATPLRNLRLSNEEVAVLKLLRLFSVTGGYLGVGG